MVSLGWGLKEALFFFFFSSIFNSMCETLKWHRYETFVNVQIHAIAQMWDSLANVVTSEAKKGQNWFRNVKQKGQLNTKQNIVVRNINQISCKKASNVINLEKVFTYTYMYMYMYKVSSYIYIYISAFI